MGILCDQQFLWQKQRKAIMPKSILSMSGKRSSKTSRTTAAMTLLSTTGTYIYSEGLKNWCFVHQGLWTHYQRDTDEFFTKTDHGKLIWKYRLNVFLAISFSFNCTGRSASCFDCLLDRKTRNYVLTSWYF